MKICIFGAGSVGGPIAARLAKGGAEVSVVARGDHLVAIQKNGIIVQTPDGELTARVTASADPRELGIQDAVIVAVKAPSVPAVAASIAPLLDAHTPVVFAINGIPWWYFHRLGGEFDGRQIPCLDPNTAVLRAIDHRRVIGCVVYTPASIVEPGTIRSASRDNKLILGELDGSSSGRVNQLASVLCASGIGAKVSPSIRDEIWIKLLQNLAASSPGLLTGMTVKDIYREPDCAAAGRRILHEGAAIARALGCAPQIDVEMVIKSMQALAHKSSALQDLERGRPVEVDCLFVVPLEFARMLDVPTPTLDLLTALIKLRLRAAGLYHGPEPAADSTH
jgi:2-dehydropantoate 2-reductase